MNKNPGLISPREFAQYIDHTLLRPEATAEEIERLCDEAFEYNFKAVCVERQWIAAAAKRVQGKVLVATVISFPQGSDSFAEKTRQAKEAFASGATELDMVLNREFLKTRNLPGLLADIRSVVDATAGSVKVILETSELTQNEKVIACAISRAAGAQFVKTSTGFSKSGATVEDVRLMRETVGPEIGVKASGGIRTLPTALEMIAAGASRLGTSASVALIRELGSQV